MSYQIRIAGVPKAQPRVKARGFKVGKSVRVHIYTPDTANDWKEAIRDGVREVGVSSFPPHTSLEVQLLFDMPRPRSHFGSRLGEPYLKTDSPKDPTTKPDLDNLTKAVWDALNGIIWHDDSNITRTVQEKNYTEGDPGLTIHVRKRK